jgi:RNA polymerase sigma factor (sigma-70 family)
MLLDSVKIAVRWFRGVANGSERLSDRQLLQRFRLNRDEAAFAALLERHGSMVLGVCRRVLGCPQTSDDAFQATFLVLFRRAGSLAWRESLGSWLHEVAYRVALKARVSQQRRHDRERLAARMNLEHHYLEHDRSELQQVVDAEVASLPEKYRQPIVLCYLEGRTHEEAAAELGWPIGTVKGRLARGRELLRKRLVRRGFASGTATLASIAGQGVVKAEVSAALAQTTQELAKVFLTGQLSAGASAPVLSLAEGMVRTMALRKMQHAIVSVVVLVVLGGGVGLMSRSLWAVQGGEPGDSSRASSSDKGSDSDKGSKGSAEPDAKLNQDLKDRREMLLRAFNGRMKQWDAGRISLDPLKDDLRALVKVSGELYSDKKERVTAIEECIKLAKDLAKLTEAKVQGGLATEADKLEAKVLVLEIQAVLLHEQNKTAPTVDDKDKLTYENTKKIKSGTTTYKDVVELLGEPASKNTTDDGKVRNAKWISGEKSLTVTFEDEVVRIVMSHAIPVPENPKLTLENLEKIKRGTTTFKEVVELFGEPTSTGTKDGKVRSALWISGIKNVNIGFDEDGVVQSINPRGLK